jgi:hypothetical protein
MVRAQRNVSALMTLEQLIGWLEDNSTLLQAIVAVGVIALGIWAIVTGVPRSILRGWRALERRYTDYRAYRMAMSAAPRPDDFKPVEPSAKPIDLTGLILPCLALLGETYSVNQRPMSIKRTVVRLP